MNTRYDCWEDYYDALAKEAMPEDYDPDIMDTYDLWGIGDY